MVDKKQITLAVLLLAAIALFFWTQSRFPALDTKAQMGQRTSISAIAFDVILPVDEGAAFVERVIKSAVNWGYTNWKGMTFGLCFAGAFLTLLRLLPSLPPSRFHAINALKGLAIGVPLGVCANCSTPIAHGMVKAGTRVETALATLLSSPTLNLFVLTMSFSLLPFHLALTKLLGVLAFILLVLPWLVRLTITDDQQPSLTNLSGTTLPLTGDDTAACELPATHWKEALARVTRQFRTNLWTVVKATLPLMLLAGVLGAVAIESVPFSVFQDTSHSVLALIGISIVGAFLPVPIAFDIIIVTTLLAVGFPVGLSMALLFSLGIFSVYPAMVIARQVSVRLSLSLFVMVILFSATLGAIADKINQSILDDTETAIHTISDRLPQTVEADIPVETLAAIAQRECATITDTVSQQQCLEDAHTPPVAAPLSTPDCAAETTPQAQMHCYSQLSMQHAVHSNDRDKCDYIPMASVKQDCIRAIVVNKVRSLHGIESARLALGAAPLPAAVQSAPLSLPTQPSLWVTDHQQGPLHLKSMPRNPTSQPPAPMNTVFASVPAHRKGLALPLDFSLSDFYEPFSYGRGVASGDINNDSYPDIVFATATGPVVFINTGGAFQRVALPLSSHGALNTFLVSLVDLNGDDWLDLFFTTYGGTNYYITNAQGTLSASTIQPVPNVETNLTLSAGFVDKDLDGDLDIFLGNWTAGAENSFSASKSRNAWVINQGDHFTLMPDTQAQGETLSVLFSDFTNDNQMDFAVANDNLGPDLYFSGSPQSDYTPIMPGGIIPTTSLTTMSIDTADINNDLLLDIFTTDMSFGDSAVTSYCDRLQDSLAQQQCHHNLSGWQAIKQFAPSHCSAMPPPAQQPCVIGFIIALAKTAKDPAICEKIPANAQAKLHLCREVAKKVSPPTYPLTQYIPQVQRNTLLLAQPKGTFVDGTEAMAVNASFWSWNSKIADLDNDQWQDIFVGNGFGFGDTQNEIHSNQLFHNQAGQHFVDNTEGFGLTQFLNTPSYTYIDMDLDGDLDIIATTIMGQPQVYVNHTQHKSISVRLRDHRMNPMCIGCKVIVHYGENKTQLREIKLSGGFLSFDAPVAYVGLADHSKVTQLDVVWSDGTRDTVNHAFTHQRHYAIERGTR